MLRERFLNAVNFEENYLIGFIITHNYLITAKLRVCNWDSVSNEKLRDYVQSPSQIRRHKFELGHIDKLRMLSMRVQYWGAWLEPVDLHLPRARLNREIPLPWKRAR